MNDMIEKLKKNEIPFGLLSSEEQECLVEVKRHNCTNYLESKLWTNCSGGLFANTVVYRIKPDYQPEPKLVDCEIYKKAGTLWAEFDGIKYKIFELLSQEEFAGFYHTGGDKQTEVQPEWVARYFPNVIARFEVK